MIKTQHCPNCEATEQKLHDFRQEVSDALHVWYDGTYPPVLDRFLIPKPKRDPLVDVLLEMDLSSALIMKTTA